jgi:hypothetical protein
MCIDIFEKAEIIIKSCNTTDQLKISIKYIANATKYISYNRSRLLYDIVSIRLNELP